MSVGPETTIETADLLWALAGLCGVQRVPFDTSKNGGAYAYRAQLEPQTQELRLGDARHALRPGMQLTAEIKLAERTVLEYILSPVQKIAAEAGRER